MMASNKMLPSPDSTYAPSPSLCLGESDGLQSPLSSLSLVTGCHDVENSYVAPLLGNQSANYQHDGSNTNGSKTRAWWVRLLVLVPAFAIVCCFLRYFLQQGNSASPRIWNPDLRREYSTEPLAKTIIRQFDAYNMARGGRDDPITFRANVERYMLPDMVYESVGFGNWKTPAGWARGEEHNYGMTFPETIFTQMLFFGDKHVSTTTTYGSALWTGDFLGVQASNTWVNLRITDFYHIREEAHGWGRIEYNFMMIDWADLMRQVGRSVLPPAPLPEGRVLPPDANDGVPAPLSVLVQAEGRDHVAANSTAQAALNEWVSGEAKATNWYTDLVFYGPGGIGLARDSKEYEEHVLTPFHNAFANRTVITKLSSCEGNYCAAFGEFHVKGVATWLGLPTVGKKLAIRFGMHWRIVDEKVKEGWTIFDMPGLFSQLGLDFWAMASKAK